MAGNSGTSRVEVGNSGFLSSFDKNLGVLIEFQQGSQASSHVRHGTLLSSLLVKGVFVLQSSSGV